MFNNNFMVTLIAMIAMIFALFKTEIKEGFTTNGVIGTNADGTAKNGSFGPWAGNGIQMSVVGDQVDKRGNIKMPKHNYKLGYDMTKSFPQQKENYEENDTYKLGYNASQSFPRGVDTTRNIQTAPPPRFQVTGPKLNHYSPIDMAKHAVDTDHPITHAEDVVHSNFGQMQRDSRKSVKENYTDYADASVPLPADMCNVNLLGTESQPVIYDRVMYSNIRSRTRGQGDYIRGDLMITPDNYKPGGGGHPQWFQVSAKPNRDLNPGCMEFLGGKNEQLSLGVAQADIDVASFGL